MRKACSICLRRSLKNSPSSMSSWWSALTAFLDDLWRFATALLQDAQLSKYSSQLLIYLGNLGHFNKIVLTLAFVFLIIVLATRFYTRVTMGICRSERRLDGKVAIVTGANCGIGLETARDLALRGARVIFACRNLDRGKSAVLDVARSTDNLNLVMRQLDLASMASVKNFAMDILNHEKRLDILVLNAGVMMTQKYMTEDNLELHMATNHLGHFLLTQLLLPLMTRSGNRGENARVVVVSSVMHKIVGPHGLDLDNLNAEKRFEMRYVYGQTKLANILFTRELARRLQERNLPVIVNALHPGGVQTQILRDWRILGFLGHFLMGLALKSAWEGAQTSIFLAVDESLEGVSGEYFVDCKRAKTSQLANDMQLARALWERSKQIVAGDDLDALSL